MPVPAPDKARRGIPRLVPGDVIGVYIHGDAAENDMREAFFERDLDHEQARRSLPVARVMRETEIAAMAPYRAERHRELVLGAVALPPVHLIGVQRHGVIDGIGEEHKRVIADKRRNRLAHSFTDGAGCAVFRQRIAATADDKSHVSA